MKDTIFEHGEVEVVRRDVPELELMRGPDRLPLLVGEQIEVYIGGWEIYARLSTASELRAMADDLNEMIIAVSGAREAVLKEAERVETEDG